MDKKYSLSQSANKFVTGVSASAFLLSGALGSSSVEALKFSEFFSSIWAYICSWFSSKSTQELVEEKREMQELAERLQREKEEARSARKEVEIKEKREEKRKKLGCLKSNINSYQNALKDYKKINECISKFLKNLNYLAVEGIIVPYQEFSNNVRSLCSSLRTLLNKVSDNANGIFYEELEGLNQETFKKDLDALIGESRKFITSLKQKKEEIHSEVERVKAESFSVSEDFIKYYKRHHEGIGQITFEDQKFLFSKSTKGQLSSRLTSFEKEIKDFEDVFNLSKREDLKNELGKMYSSLLKDVKNHLSLKKEFLREAKKIFKEYKEHPGKFSEGINEIIDKPNTSKILSGGEMLRQIKEFSEEKFVKWIFDQLTRYDLGTGSSEILEVGSIYFSFDISESSAFGKFLRSRKEIILKVEEAIFKLLELSFVPRQDSIVKQLDMYLSRAVNSETGEYYLPYKIKSLQEDLTALQKELDSGEDEKKQLEPDNLNIDVA